MLCLSGQGRDGNRTRMESNRVGMEPDGIEYS